MIEIISNGSKWAGEQPDSIADLLEVLAGPYVLDRTFEEYGDFIYRNEDGKWRAWGNFLELSHVFNILADTREELAAIEEAVRLQKERPDYTAQPDAATRRLLRRVEGLERLTGARRRSGLPPFEEREAELAELKARLVEADKVAS
jgi:hypothetical protein